MHGVGGEAASHSFVHDDDARALTTFGKTSTASARDDTLAAAEFCDLSWLRAARDSLVKLPNAVSDVSNTASINVARYFNVDLMVMLVLFGGFFLYFGFATWH